MPAMHRHGIASMSFGVMSNRIKKMPKVLIGKIQINDHPQSVALAPSRGFPHSPSSGGGR